MRWFEKKRTEMIQLYAGDLFAFIDGISQAEWMRKNVASSVTALHGNGAVHSGASGSVKKKGAALARPAPTTPGQTSGSAVARHTVPGDVSASMGKKERVWIGPFARSSKLKPLRTGTTKHVEKMLFESYGLPARPVIPVDAQCEAYDDLRGFMLMLIDERKLLDKMEAQLQKQ